MMEYLSLLVAPRVTVPHREVSQQVGATTVMTCLILTNPAGTFSWLRHGRKLAGDSKYELANWTVGEYQYRYMMALTIHDLALTDYGAYQCVAENVYGRSEGDMSVFGMSSAVFTIFVRIVLTVILQNVLKQAALLYSSMNQTVVLFTS